MTDEGTLHDSIIGSRRLTGPNLFSRREGALLELRAEEAVPSALARWRALARDLCASLGWVGTEVRIRESAALVGCFISAPVDALETATEVNEQAWSLALRGATSADPSVLDNLRRAAAAESSAYPNLASVHADAHARGRAFTFDDTSVTLGCGSGSRTWPLTGLPPAVHITWDEISEAPTALVTGSNGKTTTTRLVAAMWMAAGAIAGWSCSDGVWIGGEQREAGDYAGPAGAREVIRSRQAAAAVLETARGGILRRGLAITRANAAIVTNISADHFGEYGIESLDDLAEVKGVVARALGPGGTLVLNADDAVLLRWASRCDARMAWFSVDRENGMLPPRPEGHAATVHGGRAVVFSEGRWHDLGAIVDMPLTLKGAARYNIANVLGAALLGSVLGIPLDAIRQVLLAFGSAPGDNPGRLEVMSIAGITLLVDYAHNPGGLAALCEAAATMPAKRRLFVLGQAGNRGDDELRELVRAALRVMSFDHVVIKEMPSLLRGRAPGELPRLFREELLALGMHGEHVTDVEGDPEAMREAVAWARPGDLLICPVHSERDAVQSWIGALSRSGWRPGQPLPA